MLAAYDLSKFFPIRGAVLARTTLKAVDGASLRIKENQIVGLVGESGSGKSTFGRCLIRLLEPTSGEILFNIPDAELAAYEAARARKDEAAAEAIADKYSLLRISGSGLLPPLLRLREAKRVRRRLRLARGGMNVVFQDPYSSLNPRWKVSAVISEPMLSTHYCTRTEAEVRARELLREVGLPEFFEDRYPHELSGGQRQRVAIARAISTNPKLLILDEPTSALDVSVQAQILNMLRGLRDKYGISMLLITHNIAVIAYLAESVYVMYAGKIMEWGAKHQVLRDPQHPYTKALMSAVPVVGEAKIRTILRGDPPNLIYPPIACRFHPRCPVAFEECGWSAEEVAEDLGYLIAGKYYGTFGDAVEVTVEGDSMVIIRGTTDAAHIRELVRFETEDVRSLKGIQVVDETAGGVLVRLHDPVEPEMYPSTDGREVKCLLFRMSAPAPVADVSTSGLP
jgi:peptide/nickel transport system ATP-binding protein